MQARNPSLAPARRRSARLVATLLLSSAASGARAGDASLDTLVFGSLDAGAATFLSAGAKIALESLDRPGFAALVSVGAGRRTERPCACAAFAGSSDLSRYTAHGSALVGYQWFQDWGVVGAFLGPEAAFEALSDGRAVAALPVRVGVRFHDEVWARPTDETLVTGTAILGTARTDAWVRASWGYRLWSAYLGPEASLYADRTGYRKWAAGLHATDFAVAGYSFRLSAGVQKESSGVRYAPYIGISAWTPL